MQDDTILGIVGMIFFGSMVYTLIAALIGLLFAKRFRSELPIWHFRKRRILMKTYILEPNKNNKKLRTVYRLNRVAGFFMGLMFVGQIIITNYGYGYLATTIMCLLCFIGWLGTKGSLVRRSYLEA
ncbi:hypothetical protein C5Z25_05270 [Lactobacillus sp. CBA3605]|uniref:hypothetical protein n=1 Tax=Lactobacillus sp. CBA3605 TaxID=2099788 RepID=UPI000CFC3F0E|nr:hypothetical protein [Lactobacillus sp. CBA3605]AVK61207.1 hypothetical protein C5Z25_05270 [Lactobacillus sp. CBA3605]